MRETDRNKDRDEIDFKELAYKTVKADKPATHRLDIQIRIDAI